MIIEIKGKQYNNPRVEYDKGTFEIRIVPTGGFADLVDDFGLEAGDEIIQYNDNNEIIGKWNVTSMNAMEMPVEGGDGTATIRYNTSQIGVEAQEAISADVEDTTDALLELCELIAIIQDESETGIERAEDSIKDINTALTTIQNIATQINETVSHWESMYNSLADRVGELENK